MHRKDYALELFRQGFAPRVLFSVGRFEIRRFSKMHLPVPLDLLRVAQELPPQQRHYLAYFQGHEVLTEHVLPGRFGTLTEISALARWLGARPEIRSVLLISNDTHLRRIRMCCRSLLNPKLELAFLAAPLPPGQPSALTNDGYQPDPPRPEQSAVAASARDDLLELLKLSIYWVLLKFR